MVYIDIHVSISYFHFILTSFPPLTTKPFHRKSNVNVPLYMFVGTRVNEGKDIPYKAILYQIYNVWGHIMILTAFVGNL